MHPVTFIWLMTYLLQAAATVGPAFILWLQMLTLQMSDSFGPLHAVQAIINGMVCMYSFETFGDAIKQRDRIREWIKRR